MRTKSFDRGRLKHPYSQVERDSKLQKIPKLALKKNG
jgi:hypothetical protein